MEAKLKLLTALQKAFLDEEPAEAPGIPLSGFRNEVLSFQVAYRIDGLSPDDRPFLTVAVESPIRDAVRVRRVAHVPVGLATFPDADDNYLRRTAGLYPDLLIDIAQTRLRVWPGQWQSLWIDVECAESTPAGTHPIRILLATEDGREIGTVATEATLLPTSLPPQTLLHTKWLHCDSLSNFYHEPMWTERFWAIVERFIALAVRRGINMMLTPIHTPPLDTRVGQERPTCQLVDIAYEDGEYTFGFDRLRRWVEMCRRCGVEYFEMAHLFTQWGARFTPKIVARQDGQERRIFGWDVPAQSDAYRAFLAAYLPALTDELRALGIADRTFFHISDEPDADHLADYMTAKAIATPYLEGFPIIDALSNVEFYRQGVIEKPIPANNHIEPFLAEGIQGLWTYYCVGQYKDVSNLFIAMPSARNRVFGLQLYKYDIEGILQWGYNFYYSQYADYPIDPFGVTDADGFVPAGDPFQVYPGPDGHPLESLRMMVTQQALYDLRACRLLESLTSRAFVMECLEGALVEPITFSRYPKDDAYLLSTRARINAEIMARGGGESPSKTTVE
ncbi:DUF4091 domain-containing protein [Eubacteriales bacterium OttesenSCG-928-A19]|nr:DUF4091 domain-containing protein [Eubacteriales bacterium OttesenSCG-928-A19]